MAKKITIAIALVAVLLGVLLWLHHGAAPQVPDSRDSAGGGPSTPEPPTVPSSAIPSQGDPNKRAHLIARVCTPDGKPLAGARIYCNFMSRPKSPAEPGAGEKGRSEILSVPKGMGFIGNPITGKDGVASFEVSLPPQPAYAAAWISVMADADEKVLRKGNEVTIPPIPAGELREVTLVVELGVRLRGRFVGLDPEDYDDLFVKVSRERPPSEPGPEANVFPSPDSSWYELIKLNPDGSFVSPPVPPVPLHLVARHHGEKYAPIGISLNPPYGDPITVTLAKTGAAQNRATLVLKIVNPPAKAFPHFISLFFEDERRVMSLGSILDTGPDREKVLPGRYQVFVLGERTPLWAHANCVATANAATEVLLTLEKCASVSVRVVDRSSGSPPKLDRPEFTCGYKILGTYYDLFFPSQGELAKNIMLSGRVFLDTLPPGEVRLTLTDRGNRSYRPATVEFVAAPGDNPPLEFLLEKNE